MNKDATGILPYVRSGRRLDGMPYAGTAKVTADKARIDRLKEQLRSTPAEVDFERVRIMKKSMKTLSVISRSSAEPNLWQPCWKEKRYTLTKTFL